MTSQSTESWIHVPSTRHPITQICLCERCFHSCDIQGVSELTMNVHYNNRVESLRCHCHSQIVFDAPQCWERSFSSCATSCMEWRKTAPATFSLRWTYTTPPLTHAIGLQLLNCTMCSTYWRLQSSESISSWVSTRCRSATLRLRHNIVVLCLWLSSVSAWVIFKVLVSNDNQTLHGDQTMWGNFLQGRSWMLVSDVCGS